MSRSNACRGSQKKLYTEQERRRQGAGKVRGMFQWIRPGLIGAAAKAWCKCETNGPLQKLYRSRTVGACERRS